jgi:uncharacterized protein YbcC (UPF0753/DUF2309 family)
MSDHDESSSLSDTISNAGPISGPESITDAHRKSLRSKVAHAAELLHEQGPISTFIHTNPLHSLEHLHFDEAVAKAERLLGGRGHLPNEEFRQLYHQGRITDQDLTDALNFYQSDHEPEPVAIEPDRVICIQDVLRQHLVYGIEPLDPAHLPWKIDHEQATQRLRPDLPRTTKDALLAQARHELERSLDRIGREWTLAEWVQGHLDLNLPRHLRELLLDEFRHRTHETSVTLTGTADAAATQQWLNLLDIPLDRRDGYLRCIDRQLYAIGMSSQEYVGVHHASWLRLEYELLRELVPRHLGLKGNFGSIKAGYGQRLEAFATTNLWHAALAVRGLDDPLSPTNPDTFVAEDRFASRRDALYRRVMAVEQDGGAPLPLTAGIRAAIEDEVHHVGRCRDRRWLILSLVRDASESVAPHSPPPLTLTADAQKKLQSMLAANGGHAPGLARLAGLLQLRKGLDWPTWDRLFDRPLFIGSLVNNDESWKTFLRDHIRVRVTPEVQQALQEELSQPQADRELEGYRKLILGNLSEDGLTILGWKVLQEYCRHWQNGHTKPAVDPLLEERLCQVIRTGLRDTELTRPSYEALQQLIEHRKRTSTCRQLLADLHHMDARQHLVKRSHEDLAATMEGVGHHLTLSDLLHELTGIDIADRVNRYMTKWCGAFLDQGIASWSMPGRELGFYRAWKVQATKELSLALGGVDGWREAVAALPDRPEDSLLLTLHALQIPERDQTPYLGRRLVKLSGWAGLVKWREHHPHHPHQKHQHIDLVEFLAVRLFCESLLIRHVCRLVWGEDGNIPKLSQWLREHPYEFYLRREFFRGGLPDYLESRCTLLFSSNPQHDRDRWIRLAEMVYVYREATTVGRDPLQTACHNTWRLFQLSQLLGLSADQLRKISEAGTARLLSMLDRLPSSAHGPIWQHAFERHYQQEFLSHLDRNKAHSRQDATKPRAQLVFCIDEREESIRRHVEAQDPSYETFGTAGFFGVVMNYSALGGHGATPLCPVVITPSHAVHEEPRQDQMPLWNQASRREDFLSNIEKLFLSFKKNFIVSYFVIDVAVMYMAIILLGKTVLPRRFAGIVGRLHDWFVKPVQTRLTLDADSGDHSGHSTQQIGFLLDQQIATVEGQLRVIGLTRNFARLVIFLGHGSTSQNNPHESAHDCGACGGKHGGPNARALAAMANKPEIRLALRERGIDIPSDTYFIGAQHNTASDLISYFETERIPASHRQEFDRLVADCDKARALNAQERCRILPLAPKNANPTRSLRHMERRSVDFSQVHPEWGHATNASVIVGRRILSKGLYLDRRTFMQSYDPFQDPEGTILERILTAVGPVVAGIGLEYYFSRVDNRRYGSGTKVPHNVSGLVGVMDGAQSDLRTGLPFQMVWVHEPMRLTIMVDGYPAIVSAIVQRHRPLQKLFDNMWLHLIVLDVQTGQFVRYQPSGHWATVPTLQPTAMAG